MALMEFSKRRLESPTTWIGCELVRSPHELLDWESRVRLAAFIQTVEYTKHASLLVRIMIVEEQVEAPQADEDRADRLTAFDDPVRMYLNQMGKVPLLT